MLFFNTKTKIAPADLEKEFKKQSATLLEKDYPALLGISPTDFQTALNALWQKISTEINGTSLSFTGNIPLLIVVSHLPFTTSIQHLGAHSDLDFNLFSQDTPSPQGLVYCVLDVEDGNKMIAKSPQESVRKFEKQSRFPLNLQESVALLTHHPQTLHDHYITINGTFYKKDGQKLPLLWLLDDDGEPELHYAWFNIAHGKYGAASGAKRINI